MTTRKRIGVTDYLGETAESKAGFALTYAVGAVGGVLTFVPLRLDRGGPAARQSCELQRFIAGLLGQVDRVLHDNFRPGLKPRSDLLKKGVWVHSCE
ncbi:hypothetical protein [Paraburkholderia pallida]|uniref:Uncharacterized protein n=1 Tax=Paraburkholderia pallida TaxID=2547399 RepID=A0A4P7CUD2_9BURK|nr:hypothetical protein [Paraburkholderia pallida]QBQ98326.1 hypothetical protein E1956_14875 [Paraburkholderia pallida]